MIQSRGQRLLLLVPLRMIQSGASGLFSLVNARVVLRPFVLFFPRMIQSCALHGLVCALLHYHGLVRVFASLHDHGRPSGLPHRFCMSSSSLLLLPSTSASSSCLLLCITTALSSPWLPYLFAAPSSPPPLCCTTAFSSQLLLCIIPAVSIGLFLCFTPAPSSSLLPCVSPAPFTSLPLCISSALSFALPPGSSPLLHHLGLGLLFPSPLAATFPWTLQPAGWEPLLVDPPREIRPGAADHLSPALRLVAAPSCSVPDLPVRGVCLPRVGRLSCRGCVGFCCLIYPGCSCLGRLAAPRPRVIQSGVRIEVFECNKSHEMF